MNSCGEVGLIETRSLPPPHAGCPRGDPGSLPVLTPLPLSSSLMKRVIEISSCLVLLAMTFACSGSQPQPAPSIATQSPVASAPSDNYPSLAIQAREMGD